MKKPYDSPELDLLSISSEAVLSSSVITGDADLPIISDGPSFIYFE